jgi:hypothetical protein
MGEAERGEAAPRVYISFWCASGHEVSPSFASDAEIPELWDCPKCGAPAGQDKANPALAGVISGLARRNAELLETSRPFARGIKDGRLALEVDLIQTLADDLNTLLMNRDPLSQAVHHSKMDVAALFLKRFPAFALMRLRRPR